MKRQVISRILAGLLLFPSTAFAGAPASAYYSYTQEQKRCSSQEIERELLMFLDQYVNEFKGEFLTKHVIKEIEYGIEDNLRVLKEQRKLRSYSTETYMNNANHHVLIRIHYIDCNGRSQSISLTLE